MAAHHTDPPDRPPIVQTKASQPNRTNGIVPKGHGEKFTHNGKTMTIYEWAKEIGIPHSRLYHRIKTYGWPLDQALKPERRPRPPTHLRFLTVETPDGLVTKPMSVWSAELGILMPTISRRLSRGWTDAQALQLAPSPSEMWHRERQAEQESTDPFQAIVEATEDAIEEPEWDPDPFRIFPKGD